VHGSDGVVIDPYLGIVSHLKAGSGCKLLRKSSWEFVNIWRRVLCLG
jgi:hypothetical protein